MPAKIENALVPQASEWMDANFNVMLVGDHGVGKTQVVKDVCAAKGIKMKYFSCSTLDPFTDLVGVPFARKDEDGTESLKMVRPRDIDEAEIIFFDEFNRADSKVHNAVFEIIQFHTLNGEPLPNLRAVWAAMNPPKKEYDVETLDPALVDRFDVFKDVQANLSVDYLVSQGIRRPIAQALKAWHGEQNNAKRDPDKRITPRRVEKMAKVYEATGEFKCAIPLWFETDWNKLRAMLTEAEHRAERETATPTTTTAATGSTSNGPTKQLQYDHAWMEANVEDTAEYLRDHQDDHETHKAVKDALQTRHAPRQATTFGPILDALTPSILEALTSDMAHAKLARLRDELVGLDPTQTPLVENLTRVVVKACEDRGL